MLMKKEELATVMSLLKSERRPIDVILAEFNSKFPRTRHFSVCFSLSQLLHDRSVLHPSERLIAFAILYQCYSARKPSANPFTSLMIKAACDEQAENYERAFLLQLLRLINDSNGKEIFKQPVVDYAKSFDSSDHEFPKLEELEQKYCNLIDLGPYYHLFMDCSVKKLLRDPGVPHVSDPNNPEIDLQPGEMPKTGYGDRDDVLARTLESLMLGGLSPRFIRPFPPRYPVQESELRWIEPDNSHEIVWDHVMCADTSRGATVRDLLEKALVGSLSLAQQKHITMEFAKDPKLVYHCGITPRKLPLLVEQNPQIALLVLTKLINSPEISEYFDALISMTMSQQSLEVVNRLTTAVELPKEFVRLFVTSCISFCVRFQVNTDNDKYLQNRHVRLLCVFLHSLMRNRMSDVKDLFIEVQAFCIQFPRIREVAALFRLLKKLE